MVLCVLLNPGNIQCKDTSSIAVSVGVTLPSPMTYLVVFGWSGLHAVVRNSPCNLLVFIIR